MNEYGKIVFLFLILIVSVAHAKHDYLIYKSSISPDMGWIFFNMFEQSYYDVPVEYDGHRYVLVVQRSGIEREIRDKILIILDGNELVYNQSTIQNILLNYYNLSNSDLVSDLDSLKISFHNAVRSRDRNSEYLCMQYTGGIDFNGSRLRCYDEEGCLANCRRVEICDRLSFGIGKPFIYEIMRFNQIIDKLDKIEDELDRNISTGLDTNNLNIRYINRLNRLISLSEEWQLDAIELSDLKLSNNYNFCPEMGVDPILLTDLYKKTDRMKSDVKKLSEIYDDNKDLMYSNLLLFPIPFRR